MILYDLEATAQDGVNKNNSLAKDTERDECAVIRTSAPSNLQQYVQGAICRRFVQNSALRRGPRVCYRGWFQKPGSAGRHISVARRTILTATFPSRCY